MNLVKSSFEILEQNPGLQGIYEQIELAGRTCYKSTRPEGQSAKDFVDRMVASQHCYTRNSMVLTEKGWIYWYAYNGEKVAVIDANGSFIGFETPKRVIKHYYTGNFYYYPSLGLEVTDGHRMYGIFREGKNDFYNSTAYDTFVCGQPYKDNNGRQKTLGERMFKVPKHCTISTHTNPFYELVGFWLGDGCYQSQTINKLVFHLKKKRKIEYLKKLCEELGYTFEIGKSDYYKVCSPQIGAEFNQLFYHGGKCIPNMYKADDAIAIKSIILGLINSDGSKGINTKTITFTSTSLAIIQWLNNVAAIGGFTVSFRGVCHETPVHNTIYKILLLDTDYTINNDSRNPDSKVRITNKTEDVYCVTVSTGLILVKGDNGVTSICGNCAMLEQGTVYIKVSTEEVELIRRYRNNPYSKVVFIRSRKEKMAYITTNMRVIYENNWIEDLKYLCYPTKYHNKRITVKFVLPIGISREFIRHRAFSFAEQSTRYCNYSRSKFNNELTFIVPPQLEFNDELKARWHKSMKDSENTYMYLVTNGWKPQEARGVLPLDTKTELIMTGFVSDWKHFFKLRTSIIAETGKPHPQASELADPLYKEFINKDFIKSLI